MIPQAVFSTPTEFQSRIQIPVGETEIKSERNFEGRRESVGRVTVFSSSWTEVQSGRIIDINTNGRYPPKELVGKLFIAGDALGDQFAGTKVYNQDGIEYNVEIPEIESDALVRFGSASAGSGSEPVHCCN